MESNSVLGVEAKTAAGGSGLRPPPRSLWFIFDGGTKGGRSAASRRQVSERKRRVLTALLSESEALSVPAASDGFHTALLPRYPRLDPR